MTKSMKAVRDRKTDNRRISQNMEKAFLCDARKDRIQGRLPRDDRYKMYDLQTSIVLGYRGFILYLSAVYNPKSNKEVHHSWQKLN